MKALEMLQKHKRFVYPTLAALIPAVLMTIFFASMGMTPFGDKSILVSDMTQQYIDYFSGYRDVLTEGKSLLYTWTTGMGMNFLGMFGYYLSSPFSLIVLLFPKSMIVEAVTFMSIAKTSACGISFYYMLTFMRKKHSATDLMLTVMYALSTYNILNYFNLMWIDGVIMLPLIIIGVEKILSQRKMAFFTLSLFILFIENFYISFMVGFFVFIWFVFRIVCEYNKDIIKSCVRFFGGVVLAAAAAAMILIPVYFSLKSVYNEMTGLVSQNPVIQTTFPVLFQRAFAGSYDTMRRNGSAHIYCGILALVMIPMYFFNSKISKREKIASAVVLFFLIISMMVWVLAIIWHAFRSPTWFNYRFSFVYCCFVLIMGQKVLKNLDGLRIRYIGISCAIMLALSFICVKLADRDLYVKRFVKLNLIFIVACCIFVLALKMSQKPIFKRFAIVALLIFTCFELTFNGVSVLIGLDKDTGGFNSIESYRTAAALNKNMIATAESLETDETFYRMENQYMRWSNDNIGNGYNGIAHYSSLSNRAAFNFMKNIGMLCCTDDRYLRYFGTTNLIDDLFGVKYVADSAVEKHGYSKVAQYENNVSLFKNENALPLAYGVSDDILDLEIVDLGDPFINQNMFLSALMGQQVEAFKLIEDFAFMPQNFSEENGYFTKTDVDSQFIIKFIATEAKNYYLRFDSTFNEENPIYINGVRLGRSVDDYLRGTIPLGYFEAGENVEVVIKITNDQGGQLYHFSLASLDNDVVDSCSSIFALTSQNFKADGTKATGTITVPVDESAVFTTIPYSDGWTAKVDGKKAEIKAVNNAFIAIPVNSGTHEIELNFSPKGFKIGVLITIFGVLAMIVVLIYNDRRDLFNMAVKKVNDRISKNAR